MGGAAGRASFPFRGKVVNLRVVNRKVGKILKYGLSFVLAAVLLRFAFKGVAWQDFVAGVKSTDFRYVLLLLLCSSTAFVFRALRWRQLLKPFDPEISFWTVFDGVNIGNLSNCALPFAGEFVRAGVIPSGSRVKYDKSLGTIAMERAWDLLAIVLIVVGVLVADWKDFGEFFSTKILEPMSDSFFGKGWILLLSALLVIGLLVALVLFMRPRSKFFRRLCDAVAGMGQGFVSCMKMKRKGLFILYTVVLWTLYWLMCVCISRGLPAASDLKLIDTLFVMAVGNFASVIPVPGGFGAYHYIVALTLSGLFGLPWETGIVFATLCHESQAINMIVFGIGSSIHRAWVLRRRPAPAGPTA